MIDLKEKPKTLPANITIGRPSRSDGRQTITITINDCVSNCEIFKGEMTVEAFAMAITGLSHVDIDAVWRTANLGLRRENKREFVPGHYDDDKAARLAPFEVDGWIGYASDLSNGHRRGNKDGVEGHWVDFHRHVPSTPEDIEAIRQERKERGW